MGKKVAQGAGLTARQKQLLDLAIQEAYIVNTFYLSGGTALSYWYLHHRQSDDLDFFSISPFDYDRVTRWLRKQQNTLHYDRVRFDEDYGFLRVDIYYAEGERLLLDFHHYSDQTIEPGIVWKGLMIDSVIDIATNKLRTVLDHPRTRDFIDLYCIFQEYPSKIDTFVPLLLQKFNEEIDYIQLAKNFLKVVEYTDYPKMLVPFDKKVMIAFYEDLARSLRSKILV